MKSINLMNLRKDLWKFCSSEARFHILLEACSAENKRCLKGLSEIRRSPEAKVSAEGTSAACADFEKKFENWIFLM